MPSTGRWPARPSRSREPVVRGGRPRSDPWVGIAAGVVDLGVLRQHPPRERDLDAGAGERLRGRDAVPGGAVVRRQPLRRPLLLSVAGGVGPVDGGVTDG